MFQKVKQLFSDLAVYGVGDVATSVVSFLLLPLFVRYLSPADYGILGLLITAETVAKIVFRWGVDASFMRLYFDCRDETERQRLASTLLLFLVAVNGVLLALALILAPFAAARLFGVPGKTLLLVLVLANTFVGGLYFLPFHVMRIQGRVRLFSLCTFTRSSFTLVLRVVFVVLMKLGVLGIVLADIAVTIPFTLLLARWFARFIRPVFSTAVLREALRFGLPRVPHGIAQQVVGPATDALMLRLFLPLSDPALVHATVGLYSIGATIALGLKYFLAAFEYAWAPFYFSTMKEPDARRTFSAMTTYVLAVLALLAAGVSAIAPDLVRLMTRPAFHDAARVIPFIALAVVLQGIYLLTSIGLNITKHTEYYPVAAFAAAAANLGANAVLIPRYGILGPACAGVVSYATLAAVALAFSRRFYPIAYEHGRIGRLLMAGVLAYLGGAYLVPPVAHAALGVAARGITVVILYVAVLLATGFMNAAELARVRRLYTQLKASRGGPQPPAQAIDDVGIE